MVCALGLVATSGILPGGVLEAEASENWTLSAEASDNELKSTYYMISGKTISVPYTDANPTTVSQLKKTVTVADTATITVLNNGEKLENADTVAEGMTLRITAEDGTTNDYTIAQKNTYNWTLDFVKGQQGNVWFGQQKNGTGDWTNMTESDREGWPNWCVNTYYGPGIDAAKGTTSTTNTSVHGLLSAPPNSNISTAMAFRTPKSGTVSFSVKDGEPYLRQAGNSGGTVTLSLLVNDTVKQSVTLSTSNQKAADWANFDEIELNKGDVIRVVTKSNSNPSRPSVHVTPIITYVDKAVVDTETPDAPTAVRTADVTETTAHVAWEAALDNVATVGYNVYVNDEKVNAELVTATEYDLTGLTPATEYSVKVAAVDAAGNESEKSEVAAFTTTEVSKEELNVRIAEAEAEAAKTTEYTTESINTLQTAIDAAKAVSENTNATKEAVDTAMKALESAKAGLVQIKVIGMTVKAPTKVVYERGEELDTTGMVVTVTDNNGQTKELTADEYTVVGFDSETAGEKTVTVKYGELEESFTVTVKACYIVTVNGKEYTRGQYNDKVTVKAEEKDGQTFAGWKDSNKKIVSTEKAYTFYLAGDIKLTSVYDEVVTVDAQAKTTDAFILSKNANGSGNVRFVGQLIVPKGYKVQECGIIWTGKSTTIMPNLYESDGTTLTVKGSKVAAKRYTSNYQFSMTINKVPAGKTARGVIYAKMTNGTETIYVFSPENSVTVK